MAGINEWVQFDVDLISADLKLQLSSCGWLKKNKKKKQDWIKGDCWALAEVSALVPSKFNKRAKSNIDRKSLMKYIIPLSFCMIQESAN